VKKHREPLPQRGGSETSRLIEPAVPRIILALLFGVLVLYWGTLSNGFIDLDDDYYVTSNVNVNRGLTSQGLSWALTSVGYFYWQPLTWISHMLDCELFGLNPWGHHFTNVLIHAFNAALAFWALFRLTGALWPSALAAAVFAAHPLRVESVAWVAERKDLLSVLFWLLTLIAYESYVRTRRPRAYWLMFAAALAGMASKPTVVTLPFVLLLLDYWPLKRTEPVLKLITEKLPLFALSAVASVLTYLGQQEMGAVATTLSFGVRLSNAIVSYARYLGKIVYPTSLAVVYPYDANLSILAVAGSALLLLLITALCIWQARRRPYLIVGWLWFVGTLVPASGLVQVGVQAMADRHTYFPMLGFLLAVVWLLPATRLNYAWIVTPIIALLTFVQISYWKDSFTLFTRTLEVEPANPKIRNQLAYVLMVRGKHKEAIPHLEEALRADPSYERSKLNLGAAYANVGRFDDAAAMLSQYLKSNPASGEGHFTLGFVYAQQRKSNEATAEFEAALRSRLRPDQAAQAHTHVGIALAAAGKHAEAESRFRSAIEFQSDFVPAHRQLAAALINQNKLQQAAEQLSRSIVQTRGNSELKAMLQQMSAPR